MSAWIYTLRDRFTSEMESSFEDYCRFSGFMQLTELVTLDSLMCRNLIVELCDEDWKHNIHEGFRTDWFHSADYLLNRQPLDRSRHQVIAAAEAPVGELDCPPGFERCGYDIMDDCLGKSTLTNCGPIPEAFSPSMVNQLGLLDDGDVAFEVRDKMRTLEPDDGHLGKCEVWLVARRLPD